MEQATPISLSNSPATPAGASPLPQPKPARDWTWLWLLLLTAIAAAFRFTGLNHEMVWGDEAAVYWRTCGTYHQLLEILQNDGFAPLHYELFWLVQRVMSLTPSVLRFLPATAAVLMVPAMYFLARQLVNRRVALLVAAFVAVSGHIGWHAHDGKMYSHLWLFCMLSMACLLWWIRTRAGVAWWSWVASSVAMVGLHSLGWGIVALQPLLMFSHRPRWRLVLLFVIGELLIAIGPAYYYLNFNHWTKNIQERGWAASGIAWISDYSNGTPADQVRGTTNHFLFGYDFPPPLPQSALSWSWRVVPIVPTVIGAILLVGLFAYPTRRRGRGTNELPQPWWRSYLIISGWALLPPYAFYCASYADYLWPHQMLREAGMMLFESAGLTALAGALSVLALYSCANTWRGRLLRLAQLLAVSLVLVVLGFGIAIGLRTHPPGPIWVSRYLAFAWPAVIIGVCTLLMRLPLWPVRWTIISALLLANVGMCLSRQHWRQSPPIDLLAADIVSNQKGDSGKKLFMMFPAGQDLRTAMMSLEGRYYLYMLTGRKTFPSEFAGGNVGGTFGFPALSTATRVAEILRREPTATRIVVWDKAPAAMGLTPSAAVLWKPEPDRDDLVAKLPGKWSRVSADRYPFFTRWGWWLQGIWRRREYVMLAAPEPPATQPAQPPASQPAAP